MQGIPVDDLYKEKTIIANDNRITSDIFKSKLKQWRIMFYLDVLKDIQLEKIVDQFKPKNGLYLHINCANNITTFKIDYEHLLQRKESESQFTNGTRNERYSLQRYNTNKSENKYKLNFMGLVQEYYSLGRNKSKPLIPQQKSQTTKKVSHNDHIEDIVDLKCNKLRVHYFFGKL